MRANVLATVESHRCFGGTQSVYLHNSETTRSPMRVGVFQPEGEGPFPVLYFLSGLTCTEQNFITKGHVQRYAAEVGMMVVALDTSPREVDIPAGYRLEWSGQYEAMQRVRERLTVVVPVTLLLAGAPRWVLTIALLAGTVIA